MWCCGFVVVVVVIVVGGRLVRQHSFVNSRGSVGVVVGGFVREVGRNGSQLSGFAFLRSH